jgi:hypothetical protein
MLFMHSLHSLHEINTYRAGHVCLYVRPSGCVSAFLQLENYWTDFYGIWYGHYAIEDYPKNILFSLLQWVILTY